MKKITLLFLLLIFAPVSYSQLNEGFEAGIPSSWAIFNNGFGSNTWATTTAVTTPPSVNLGTTAAFMNARQNIGANNTSRNWLVTNQVLIPTNGQLRFYSRSSLNGNDNTSYQVHVSTSSQTITSSFVLAQQYTETELSAVFNVYEEKVVDLSAYSGQSVYIAFVIVMNQPTTSLTGDRWFLDDVKLVERCLNPTSLLANQISTTTANLSWANPSGATEWEIELVAVPGFPTGSGTVVTTNPYVATGLTPATQYQLYVRALCSQSSSEWVGPYNFVTGTPGRTCDSPITISGLPYQTTDNTSGYGDDYNGPQGATGCGTTVNYLGGDDVFYTFTATTTGTVNITMTPTGTRSSIFVYNSCANIGVSCVAGVANTGSTPRIINLPVTAGQTYYIVISSNPAPQSVGYTLVLQLVSCNPPTNLSAANFTLTSAQLSWTNPTAATSWQVAVQPAGSPIPTGSGVTANTNTNYLASGLTAATAYQYYVRSDCGDGTFSLWAGPFLFNTAICDPVDQCNYTFRLTDTGGDGWDGARIQVRQNGVVVATLGSTFTSGSGPINVMVPLCHGVPFDLFWLTAGGFPSEVRLSVINPFAQTMYAMTTNSTALVGTVLYTGLTNCSLPACFAPTNIVISGVTETTANVSWTASGSETTYEVIYLPTGSPAPTAISIGAVVTGTTHTLTGLTAGTVYDVYVRTNCSTGAKSPWAGPSIFNTALCSIANQCLYTFRMTNSGGNGWSGARMQVRQNGIVVATIGSTFTLGAGPVDVIVPLCNNIPFELNWSVGGTSANNVRVAVINNFSQTIYGLTTASSALVGTVLFSGMVDCLNPACLQPLNITSSNIQPFQVTLQWNNNTSTNWQVIALPTGSPAPTTASVGVPASTNPFILTGLNANTTYDFYVRALCGGVNTTSTWTGPRTATTLPTCPQPINLIIVNSTTTNATIQWTETGPATQWEVVVQAAGTGGPTIAGAITSNNPYIVTGFPAGYYEFYVRAICGPTDRSNWSGPMQFFILESVPACAAVEINLSTTTPGVINLCPDDVCVDLEANFFNVGNTTTYNIAAVPFAPPYPFTGGTPLNITTDDIWSPTVDLPFPFCFYGQNYNKVLVGSNGVITFDVQGVIAGATQVPGGNCPWAFATTIPNTGFPIKNAIYGPYQDINPAVATTPPGLTNINFQILGTSPCRVFVVNYSQVPQFSCGVSVGLQTSQIVMYETSNVIEVYVGNRTPCTTWQSGRGVIGIQNKPGTIAHFPPNRNTGSWTATNEAWRFTPAGASTVVFSWLKNGVHYSNDLAINVCPTETSTMTAQAIYTACGGAQTVITQSVLLNIINTTLPIQQNVTACGSFVLPALSVGNYYTGTNGTGTLLNAGSSITSSQQVYIYGQFTQGTVTCSNQNSFNVTINNISVNTLPNAAICDSYVLPALTIGNYYTSPGGTGTMLNAGDVITTTRTIYIFGQTNTTPNCTSENSFIVTIHLTPIASVLPNVTVCNSGYMLPIISRGLYYTGTGGTGSQLAVGSTVNTSQTIYIYAQSNTTPNCFTQSSFVVTALTATAPDMADVEECRKFVLPSLPQGVSYYTASNGTGTQLPVGSEVASTQTIYVYAVSATCTNESSFVVTIKRCEVQKGISPNDDGMNDYFDLTDFDADKLSIFNRYGRKVYSKSKYTNQWYGQSDKGDALPDGTYYFVIELPSEPTKTGWIYINRVHN